MPAWHRALWAAAWTLMLIAVVTMSRSAWMMLVWALATAAFGFLFWWERDRPGVRVRRQRRRWSRRDTVALAVGATLFVPAFYVLLRYDVVWPLVAVYVVFGGAMFLDMRHDDRRRAAEFRDS